MRKTFFVRSHLCSLTWLCLAAVVAPLSAATFSANPVADATMTTGPTGNLFTNNYGAGGALALSAAASAKGEFQAALRFDTSGAKTLFDGLYGAGSWTIQSVSLQLSAGTVNNAIFNANSAGNFNVRWLQNDSWTEGAGTPGTPTQTGITYQSLTNSVINLGADEVLGTYAYNGSSSGTFTYNLTVTGNFNADLLAGNLASLRLDAADAAVSYFFSSRTFSTTANRPLLTIVAVPEPGTVALLALGGVVFAGVIRRRPRA